IHRSEGIGRGLDLGPAQVVGAVENLPLQVAGVHHVEVQDADPADAGGRQVHGGGRAETPGTQEQHARVAEFALACAPDFREDQVAGVALDLLRRESVRSHVCPIVPSAPYRYSWGPDASLTPSYNGARNGTGIPRRGAGHRPLQQGEDGPTELAGRHLELSGGAPGCGHDLRLLDP